MSLTIYLLLLILQSSTLSSADLLYLRCSVNNYTTNSTYESNLNNLLTYLASLNSTSFTTHSVGSAYGLILCRGDASPSDCTGCIRGATKDVLSICPLSKNATIWYDTCELRYSDYPFYGVFQNFNSIRFRNLKNITTNVDSFIQVQRKLLDEVTYQAAYNSTMLFATGSAVNGSGIPRVNALAQCTMDISKNDCSRCLQEIQEQFTSRRVEVSQGGRALGESCNFRYEVYPFFQGKLTFMLNFSAPPSVPSAAVPLPALSAPVGEGKGSSVDNLNKRRNTTIAVIVSLAFGSMLLSCSIYFVWRKKKTIRKESWNEDEDLELPLYDLDTVIAATNNFSTENKLGEGGFGTVYKGKLLEGLEIAVKRLSKTSKQGVDEFKNEVLLIAKLQHRNLVRLLGCCTRGEDRMLIYEYMPNKSLDAFLFDKAESINLGWGMRFSIIIGIARGLLYLHEDSRFRIIHRDLKPSNVLLDEEMNPKISDFGLARIFGTEEAAARTRRVVGTYGYMSPEYAMDGIFSVKSDVFSFGVLVLEIVSGQRTKAVFLSEPEDNLLRKAWRLWSEGNGLELTDPAIGSDFTSDEVIRCIKVGLLCVQENPKARPKMSLVVHMLSDREGASIFEPQQPGFTARSDLSFPSSSSTNQALPSINGITNSLDVGR